jgi:hypothetical protein
MHISSEQMASFAMHRQRDFIDRLVGFIEDKTQRSPDRTALIALFSRATRYGLVTEQQVAGYVTMAWASGAHHAPADPGWIAAIMNDACRRGDDKVKALFDQADRLPRGRAAELR